MKTGFDNRGISQKDLCPVCDSSTLIIHKRKSRADDRTTWEHESSLRLLGIDSIESQMRFCPRCFHFFHFPLFDEGLIYSKEAAACRKEIYEKKYFPGKSYSSQDPFGKGWFIKNKEIFSYLSYIFLHISRSRPKTELKENPKILDWGGGDGYLAETISLISRKVLGVPCKAYCFDYHEWDRDSHSPYFDYISEEGLKKESPFDIIFLAHVLEHVSYPTELLTRCRDHLSRSGIIVAYVPFQQYLALSPKSGLMQYHQQLFSVTSLAKALKKSGLKNIHSKLYHLSYRGNKAIHVLATACADGTPPKTGIGRPLLDIYNFLNVLLRTIFRKLREFLTNAK